MSVTESREALDRALEVAEEAAYDTAEIAAAEANRLYQDPDTRPDAREALDYAAACDRAVDAIGEAVDALAAAEWRRRMAQERHARNRRTSNR